MIPIFNARNAVNTAALYSYDKKQWYEPPNIEV
jgi:hypothetical protein